MNRVEPENEKLKKEKEKAYGILGIKQGASKADIDKRYFVLVKKHNAYIKNGEAPDFDIKEATYSYNMLMGYEQNKEESKTSSVGNFLHYNKWTILAVIAVILFSISIIKVVIRPRPDFEIALLGSIQIMEDSGVKELADFIEEKIESVEVVAINEVTSISEDPYFIVPQKEAAIVAGRFVDIFIVDAEKYDYYAKAGLFISLDDYLEHLGEEEPGSTDLIRIIEEETEEHQYGIYISDKGILKEFGIIAEALIAGISYSSKHPETAVEVLKLLAGQ